jgi:hypothetical protein
MVLIKTSKMIRGKLRSTILLSVLTILSSQLGAQQNGILIGGATAALEQGALLEVESFNKGMLIPRVDLLTDIASPAEGLMAFQLQEPRGLFYHDGSNWVPWHKPVAGTVLMTGGSSTVERGDGFTVTNIGTGQDEVFLDMAYTAPPIVHVSSGVIAGVPPTYPSGFCEQSMGACNVVHLQFVNLNYQADGTEEFQSGTTNCNAAPGNRTSYSLTDPEWVLAPPTMNVGQTLRVRLGTPSNTHSVSIWGDWNQNGFFEGTERVYFEDVGDVGAITNRNCDFTIPAGACNGTTALRVTVTDSYDHNIGCGIDNLSNGETEEFEITIGGGSACVYQERQTSCNVSGVLTDRFRVECNDLDGNQVDARYYFKVTDNN